MDAGPSQKRQYWTTSMQVTSKGALGTVRVDGNAAGGVATYAQAGQSINAGTVITGLSQHVGALAGDLFSIILLNASLIGAAAVTLSTSYAFGDVFGTKHSLHRSIKDGLGFYVADYL